MVCAKVRFRFCKTGSLRLISHHDLMRCFERMLRRAALPYHSTAGFNPKPRLIFALPLPLGAIGHEEVAELELDAEVAPAEVCQRLNAQAPAGLEIQSARRIDPKATAHVRRVCYRLPLPEPAQPPDLPARIAQFLNAASCWIERTRPHQRRIDLRPNVDAIHLHADALEIGLLITAHGTARPDEILVILGLGQLLESGAILERTKMELEDEGSAELAATVAQSEYC
jgi:radical SAM-linked protein